MMSEKGDFSIFKILSLWYYNDQEWIRFSEIKERTGVAERSLARYLNTLVDNGVLQNDKKGYRISQKSFVDNMHEALSFMESRKAWGHLDSEEDKQEIARRMMTAHVGSAVREINVMALRVFKEEQVSMKLDSDIMFFWIRSFQADFNYGLARLRNYCIDRFVKECRGEKEDIIDSYRTFVMANSVIFRSFANLYLKMCLYLRPIITRKEGKKCILPPETRMLDEYVGQTSRKQVAEERNRLLEDFIKKGMPKMLVREILDDIIWIPTHNIKVE
jgi:DNA-binding HxlR family transcriptional regulator